MFGRPSRAETLTDDTKLRRALRTGLALAVLNLVLWGGVVLRAAPIETFEAFVGDLDSLDKSPADGSFDFGGESCWDCPRLILVGRELGSTWDPIPVKLLILANIPGLWSASGAPKRFGIREISPSGFVAVSSLQWVLVGGIGNLVWSSRRRKATPSLSEAS